MRREPTVSSHSEERPHLHVKGGYGFVAFSRQDDSRGTEADRTQPELFAKRRHMNRPPASPFEWTALEFTCDPRVLHRL